MSSADACSRLDQIVAQRDLDYTNAKSVTDYWNADAKLMHAIDNFPEPKTKTEQLVRWLRDAKRQNLEKFLNRLHHGED